MAGHWSTALVKGPPRYAVVGKGNIHIQRSLGCLAAQSKLAKIALSEGINILFRLRRCSRGGRLGSPKNAFAFPADCISVIECLCPWREHMKHTADSSTKKSRANYVAAHEAQNELHVFVECSEYAGMRRCRSADVQTRTHPSSAVSAHRRQLACGAPNAAPAKCCDRSIEMLQLAGCKTSFRTAAR